MDIRPTKDNWHNRKLSKKRQFSKFKPKGSSETSSNHGIPTPVIDVADSSDDRYSKRSTSDVWYQNESEEDIDGQIKAANFEDLQKASTGGHFVFSSEKQWEEQTVEKSEVMTYFTMNIKLVKAGLATIPFCRRMDYDLSMFSNDQLKRMNDEAEKKEKEYQSVLKTYEERKQRASSRSVESKTGQPKVLENLEDSIQFKNNSESGKDELDELLSITNKSIGNITLLAEQPGQNSEKDKILNSFHDVDRKDKEADDDSVFGKEDIQEWLDGVLNE